MTRKMSAIFNFEISPGSKITSMSELTKLKLIGEGSNAKVYRAYYKDPDS